MMQQRDPDSESMASISMDGIKYGIEEEKVETIPEELREEQEEGDWVIIQNIKEKKEEVVKELSDTGGKDSELSDGKDGDIADVTLHNGDLEKKHDGGNHGNNYKTSDPKMNGHEGNADEVIENRHAVQVQSEPEKALPVCRRDIFDDDSIDNDEENDQANTGKEQPDLIDEDIDSVPFPDVVSSREGSTSQQQQVVSKPNESNIEIVDIFACDTLPSPEQNHNIQDLSIHPKHTHDMSNDSGFINDAAGEDGHHVVGINKNNNNSRESLNCMKEEDENKCEDEDKSEDEAKCEDVATTSGHEGQDDSEDNVRIQPDVLPEFGLPVDVADLEEISVIVYNEDSQGKKDVDIIIAY